MSYFINHVLLFFYWGSCHHTQWVLSAPLPLKILYRVQICTSLQILRTTPVSFPSIKLSFGASAA
jgi:hypothetical protein